MSGMRIPTQADLMSMWNASGLKEKLIFTFVMLLLFRFGIHLPVYGINSEILNIAGGSDILGFLDLFSGGALGKVSIFALGIGPYITSSIIMQLMAVIIPALEKLQKEDGEAGRRKISQYTRVFTVILAAFQAIVLMAYLSRTDGAIIVSNHAFFYLSSVLTLTAGSVLVMWMSELITERGIGNGGSLIIFAGILAGIPIYAKNTAGLVEQNPSLIWNIALLLTIFFITMVLIVVMQEAIRKVIIVNPKRQIGNKVYGGVNTFIPFKLNPGGVMPIIFAVAILLFPSTILKVVGTAKLPAGLASVVSFLTDIFNAGNWVYYVIYFLMIVLLTFFYASIMPNMQPKDIADNLKKYGSSIPGIKPGRPTAEALDKILSKTTFIGAMALGIIALVPAFASYITKISTLQGIGSTSLIIMVGVALDLINQVKTHLLARNYETFLKE